MIPTSYQHTFYSLKALNLICYIIVTIWVFMSYAYASNSSCVLNYFIKKSITNEREPQAEPFTHYPGIFFAVLLSTCACEDYITTLHGWESQLFPFLSWFLGNLLKKNLFSFNGLRYYYKCLLLTGVVHMEIFKVLQFIISNLLN